ncbi:MAG: discoidin domain-containing protein [Candidatus Limnocylindrales bacterium]
MLRSACRSSGALSIVILLLLGLMATTQAQSQRPFDSLRPFEEIQASEVVITPDPSGRAAILEVDTTIDVACSVVYGTDGTFGRIAVDNDMDGGAHQDHSPVLGGLEPGATYLYRLQGTAPNGTMYVSEVMTFQTPAAAEGPTDLALGATITGVSSEFSEAFAAANAFDGDPSTEWSSSGDGDDAWVEVDLGSPRAIGEIVFQTRSMSDGSAITDSYTVTADGVEYGPFRPDEPVSQLEELGLTAQVLRFDVATSSGGNTGAVDIRVLAPAGEDG